METENVIYLVLRTVMMNAALHFIHSIHSIHSRVVFLYEFMYSLSRRYYINVHVHARLLLTNYSFALQLSLIFLYFLCKCSFHTIEFYFLFLCDSWRIKTIQTKLEEEVRGLEGLIAQYVFFNLLLFTCTLYLYFGRLHWDFVILDIYKRQRSFWRVGQGAW